MEKGTIAKKTEKGYGFIKRDGENKELFFHSNNLSDGTTFDGLNEGDEVTFEVAEGMKGQEAINLSLS